MNERNEFEKSGEIDLVDFSSNSEMQRIRENERIEREKRRLRAKQLRRAEIIRRKKINRIKQMALAWGTLILSIIVVVAIVLGVVSLFSSKDDGEEKQKTVTVSEQEIKHVNALSEFDGVVFESDNTKEQYLPAALNKMYAEIAEPSFIPSVTSPVTGSYLAMITDTFFWNAAEDEAEKIKQIIRDYPLYSNGYVWSTENSMKSPLVSSYLYDTNAAFVSAVCEVCLWEGNTSFLESVDMTGEANSDISLGMTVGEKLEKVLSHYFAGDDHLNGGGIRYNKDDGLVYVLTKDNNGTEAGKPSNIFYNFRFGYLDTYNNLVFNAAMQDLVSLYTLTGEKEKAEKYSEIALINKSAINDRLYNKKLSRYVGWIDKEDELHDNGFTALNLLAVNVGVATDEIKQEILSWTSGKSEKEGDTFKNPYVYNTMFTPAFSTVEADDDTWYNAGGEYSLEEKARFGEYWMNGGKSVLAGYYNVLAQDKPANAIYEAAKAFNDGKIKLSENEQPEPDIYKAAFASSLVKEAFGVSTDGKSLCIKPILKDGENAGLKGISFMGNKYDVLFMNGDVYVFAEKDAPVRIKLSAFEKNEMLKLTVVENTSVASTESVSADKTGTLSFAKKLGNGTYIKIEKDKAE